MKWSVNMRTKTLTIALEPWELMVLYVERKAGALEVAEQREDLWARGLGQVVDDAFAAMFPACFPDGRVDGAQPYPVVEKVAWDEICDAE